MLTPSLLARLKSISTTPPFLSSPVIWGLRVLMSVSSGPTMPRAPGFEQEGTERTEKFHLPLFPLFAPVPALLARAEVLNWACQTMSRAVALQEVGIIMVVIYWGLAEKTVPKVSCGSRSSNVGLLLIIAVV